MDSGAVEAVGLDDPGLCVLNERVRPHRSGKHRLQREMVLKINPWRSPSSPSTRSQYGISLQNSRH
jgi:hypothetical protein